MQHIDMALITGCYIAIIYLYVWVFRALEGIKDMVNKHQQDAGKHVDSKDLVYRDVCSIQVKRFEEKLEDVKLSVNVGFSELKAMIKEDRMMDKKRDGDK